MPLPPPPIPVLKQHIIYSADNGRLICKQCAGATAKYTGRDLSGQKVTPIPISETVGWREEFGEDISCEAGCTTYLQPA